MRAGGYRAGSSAILEARRVLCIYKFKGAQPVWPVEGFLNNNRMLADRPLVSVIVTADNAAPALAVTLETLRQQTYAPLELIVVDREPSSGTRQVSQHYGARLVGWGPTRAAQRNHGAELARGRYLLFLDAGHQLAIRVIEEGVREMTGDSRLAGLVVPEQPYGQGFWARCRQLERSYYTGIDWLESARFFRQDRFWLVGGYDERLQVGEDWDLRQRLTPTGFIGRIRHTIKYNQGRVTLAQLIDERRQLAHELTCYSTDRIPGRHCRRRLSPWSRYWLLLRRPRQLFAQPAIGLGLLFVKTCQFLAGRPPRATADG
jgi:glycosyltransferase involved in cell wall biosynthesis